MANKFISNIKEVSKKWNKKNKKIFLRKKIDGHKEPGHLEGTKHKFKNSQLVYI